MPSDPSLSAATPEDTSCPACGVKALRIEWRMTAHPVGTFSLAGAQTKFAASEKPWLVCGNCGVEAEGKA